MQTLYTTNTTPAGVIPETISTLAEIPETLYFQIQQYLSDNPEFDQDRLFEAAIAMFLAQYAADASDRALASRHYLNSVLVGKGGL